MGLRSFARSLPHRLAVLGVAEGDSEKTRAQKATLTLAAVCVTGLAVAWVGTYWALGLHQAAAIPFAYQIASVVSLVI